MSTSASKQASGGRRSSVDVKELDTLKRDSLDGSRPSSSKTTITQASQASTAQSAMVSRSHDTHNHTIVHNDRSFFCRTFLGTLPIPRTTSPNLFKMLCSKLREQPKVIPPRVLSSIIFTSAFRETHFNSNRSQLESKLQKVEGHNFGPP